MYLGLRTYPISISSIPCMNSGVFDGGVLLTINQPHSLATCVRFSRVENYISHKRRCYFQEIRPSSSKQTL